MSPLRIVEPTSDREFRALDGGPDMPELPAVAVCAVCGETAPLRALWQTAMLTASDLGLWARAARGPAPSGAGVAPAFAFALACELLAVAATTLPLTAIGAGLCFWLTRDLVLTSSVAGALVRAGLVFVPMMLVIHLVHHLVVAKVGGRAGEAQGGRPFERVPAIRAGLFACGWDLATGPLGVLGPLVRGRFGEARARLRGNRDLYRTSTRVWLLEIHGIESAAVERAAHRATWPFMAVLLVVACLAVGFVLLRSF